MTDELIVPLYPDHPSVRKHPDKTPLYPSKGAFLKARAQLLQVLEERYPDHFGKYGQPWAIGLREELLNALSGHGYADALLRHTLHYFSRSVRYLTNCVLSGHRADRRHLDGNPEGSVSRRELVFALTQLSGMVQRKDEAQAKQYRLWAMREMVLGFLHSDVDTASLEQAKVRKSVIKRARELADDPEAVKALQLCNRRTGAPHPSVYAMPYLPQALQKAFQKRHPDHITTGKLKRAELKAVKKPDRPPLQKPATSGNLARHKPDSSSVRRPEPYPSESTSPVKAPPKVTVRRRRVVAGVTA